MIQSILDFFKNIFKAFEGRGEPPTPKPPQVDDPVIFPDDPEPEPEEDELVSDGSDLISDPDTIGTLVVPEHIEMIEADTVIPSEPIIDLTLDPIDDVVVPITDVNPDDEELEPTEPVKPNHVQRYMWCLDNGHGKFTAGKRSPKFEDGTRFFEYEFNRDIVKRIIKKLDEVGVAYFNVVPEVETDNFLSGRVGRANAFQSDLPKLFISIHANASRSESMNHWANPPARGIETWYYTGSKRGKKLATIFQKQMFKYTGMVNRGLKATKNLYVLRNTKMTAILTENGFYNHKDEAQDLMKDEFRQLIADAHIAAILEVEKNGL